MLIYYARVSLEEGYNIMGEPKGSRLVKGKSVSLASGAKLFQHLIATGEPMKCWNCGIEASCFIANKGRNDKMGPPVLDLYAETNGGPVLMTRDHIIPKSYGGVNDNANLRVGCGPCNHGRGNELDAADVEFMRAHPELIGPKPKYTLAEGELTAAKTPSGPKAKQKINSPEEAAANKKAKAKAKRQRQKAKRKAKIQPLSSMMALALA